MKQEHFLPKIKKKENPTTKAITLHYAEREGEREREVKEQANI